MKICENGELEKTDIVGVHKKDPGFVKVTLQIRVF